jgi:nitrite reductase (NO-forming)
MGPQELRANVGERVRIFFGVGGPNITSSFHMIGRIFDTVYPEGASEAQHHLRTTLVPSGGAATVELTFQVPGTYMPAHHSLSRVVKGAVGAVVVEGSEAPDIYGKLPGMQCWCCGERPG